MPLSKKGKHILAEMIKTYGSVKKGTQVFYATIKKGKLKSTHKGRK